MSIESRIDIVVKNLNQLNKLAANLQNINKTNEQLVKGLDKVQTNLDKIGTRGFKNLNREANQTLKTVQKLSLGLAKLYRPGRAVERRGVLLGGLGAAGGLGMLSSTGAGKAIGGSMGAGSAKAAGFMSMIPGLKGAGAALTATTAKIAGVSKGLAGLGALMAAQPQLLGVAMAAWLAFGNKGLFNAAKQAEKTTVKLFGLEKALSNAKKSTGIFGAKPLGLKAFNYELKVSNDVARKLEISLNGAARAKKRLEQTRAGIKASGFAAFSQDISQPQDPVAKSVKRHNRKKQILQEINAERKKEMYLANRAERTEMRINRVLERRAKTQQKQSGMRGMMSGFSGTRIGQAVLGGGFPMLFGGGPGAVIGGALGGLGGGFAGGIGGSILGTKVDEFVQGARDVGNALKDPTAALTKLSEIGFQVNESIKSQVESLVKQGNALEAQKLINNELAKVISAKGVKALMDLDTSFDELQDASAKLFLKISSELAPAFTALISLATQFVNALAGPEYQRAAANLDPQAFKQAQKQAAQESAGFFPGTGDRKLYEQILTKLSKDIVNQATPEIDLTTPQTGTGTKTGKSKNEELQEQIQLLQRSFEVGSKIAGQEQEAAIIYQEQKQLLGEKLQLNEADFLKQVQKRDQLQENLDLWKQIKDTIAGGLTNAITGLIEGTKTLGQALAGILKQIGQILMQKALTSMLGNISFGGGGIASGGTSLPTDVGSLSTKDAFSGAAYFSSGGMVTRPTVGVIGEAGEDEYIIPASKMASSMQRYSACARGEAVIPGTGSSYAGGGGGSSTTVSYSGPILNFNSEEFVPKSAVGQIIASASARGASIGENRTLSTLKNSRSRRSALGL